jgi:hypothetical protein
MMRSGSRLAVMTVIAAVIAPPAITRAQSGQVVPDEEIDRAEKLYDEGLFHEALARYLEFRRREARPAFLFNIGQIYGELGQCHKAVEAYDQYLAEAPPDAEGRPLAKLLRDGLHPCVRSPQSSAPAEPFLSVRAEPPQPHPRAQLLRTSGYALLGLAVACAVGTGVFAALGMKYDSEASRLEGRHYDPAAMDVWAKGERANLMTVVLGVSTLATAAGGASLLIFGPATTPPSGPRSVGSAPVGLRWAGRF